MKKNIIVLMTLAGFLLLSACQSPTAKPESGTEADPNLPASMQSLKLQMDQMLPLLVEARAFKAPENKANIAARLRTLERISQNVTHSGAMKNQDPTLDLLSRGFHDDIRRSREAFDQGKFDYARSNLISTGGYCIECHTRTNSGPSFQNNEFQQVLTSLGPLDRAEYLLATRQYDAALKEFDTILKNGVKEGTTVFDLDKAAQLALQITVRYQANPDNALMVVNDILNAKDVPYYLKANARLWRSSLQQWKKEKPTRDPLKKSRELVKQAQETQKSRDDRAGDIEMMRAQALLGPLLGAEKKEERRGEALFLMAQTYESVHDLAISSMHEDYYEACVRQVPHSPWSKRCFEGLEISVRQGFTGSGGTSIPGDVQQKLSELKKLAL
ncbi:MAG: hypothetical protein ACK5P7_11065 [Bdellovibrio sp.]